MLSQLDRVHASQEQVARSILKALPERWGRMDLMSREAVAGVGQVLKENLLLEGVPPKLIRGWTGGLIVGTKRGSLAVDTEYAKTLKEGPGMASPHLFSYTLPNIPLAEAAIQYGLTGPVFCTFTDNPYIEALDEAHRWLLDMPGEKNIIVAGALDVIHSGESAEVTAKFKVVQI